MKCPVCPDATLLMMDKQGVEIDYCPSCRGVWLDRGELDKLLQLGARHEAPAQPLASAPVAVPRGRPDFQDSDHGHHRGGHHGSYRKKSWLSDIFD